MKIFPILAIIYSTAGSDPEKQRDPCKALCSMDGATICTHGSFLSTEFLCSNYYHRSAAKTDHCYSLTPIPGCPNVFPLSGNAAIRRMQVLLYNERISSNYSDAMDEGNPDEYYILGVPFIDISSPRIRRTIRDDFDHPGDVRVMGVVESIGNLPEANQ